MKKIIKLTLIIATVLTLFIACSNDSTEAMLNQIVNSQEVESYTTNASSYNSDANTIISVESNGIYRIGLYDSSNSGAITRAKIIDTSTTYRNVLSIYTKDNDTFFTVTDLSDINNPKVKLYHFNNTLNDITPTEVLLTDSTEEIKDLTRNGYLITQKENTLTLNIYELSSTTTTNLPASSETIVMAENYGYSSYTASGDFFIVNIAYSNDDDGHFKAYFNGNQANEISINSSSELDSPIVIVTVDEATNKLVVILKNGNICYGNAADPYSLGEIYDAETSTDPYIVDQPFISIPNIPVSSTPIEGVFVITMKTTNETLYIYDVKGSEDFVEPISTSDTEVAYAQDLNNASQIIEIFEITKGSLYWVVTESNGYYTITTDPSTALDEDDTVKNTSRSGLYESI